MGSLGRDRFGRLVYEGDRIKWMFVDGTWPSVHPVGEDEHVYFEGYDWWTIINECCIIDLELSPNHTNYERYFQSIGTIEEVKKAFFYVCAGCAYACDTCVFKNWGENFGISDMSLHGRTCFDFTSWLEMEATL